jgi:glycogen debranching enzyme
MTTPWTTSASSVDLGAPGSLTLVDGNTFLVGSVSGDLRVDRVEGLFMLDTRILGQWVLTIDGEPIEGISTVANGPFSVTMVGRARADHHEDSELTVIRRRHLGRGMREDLELRHFGVAPRSLKVALRAGSDFASLFEVKAGHLGRPLQSVPLVDGRRLRLAAPDDTPIDEVIIDFDSAPTLLDGDRLEWLVELGPGERFTLCAEVGLRIGEDLSRPSHRCGEPIEEAIPMGRLAAWRSAVPRLSSNDGRVVRAFGQALDDLGALRIFDPDHVDRVVIAAGAPWFMTLFGRDALITAWMALLVDHALARGVLSSLAEAQGRTFVEKTEEQPGRILHEVRYDHQSARLLGGRNVYYGTIDATPLFVMLVAEVARWTGDRQLITDLLPAVDAAMAWIDTVGDRDGDGFVEYLRATESGLANQGWKDSWDGIRFEDGRVAEAPLALCEVQGYVYAAHRARATIARALGDQATAEASEARAEQLRARFDATFWLPDRGWYAIGLDATKRPVDSLTSNIGHCLWTGVVPEERSPRLAELLTSERMFTGWGLRTIARDSQGYNPLSYHCGSVWPHDTAISVAGLAAYGHEQEAGTLADALLDAASVGGGRLPELFAGFDRSELPTPVRYPASCSPQAWAAASPLLVVRALLGLEPDLVEGRVRLRPRLPPSMSWLVVDGIPLGGGRMRVEAGPGGVEVSGLPDGVEVVVD